MKLFRNRLLLLSVLCLGWMPQLTAAPSKVQQLEEQVEQLTIKEGEDRQTLNRVQDREELMEERVDHLVEVIETSHAGINNAISASQSFLTVVSIIMGLIAAILALYVGYLGRKVRLMKDAVTDMNREMSVKENEVKSLVDQVNNDIGGLFEKIRREDTKAMLQRLTEVPEDISNLIPSFLSRELLPEDYTVLKTAYLKLKEQGTIVKERKAYESEAMEVTVGNAPEDEYLLVFFQHFLGKAIEDDDLRDKMAGYFKEGLDQAFDTDVRKETQDLGVALSKKDATYDRQAVLSAYAKALSESERTKDHPEYKDLLKEAVKDSGLAL